MNPIANSPSVTATTTNEDVQSTTGLAITKSPNDGAETTHFKVSNITGVSLSKSPGDGGGAINNGDFITLSEGGNGLRFLPGQDLNDSNATFTFDVQASLDNSGTGLSGVVQASISVTAVNDAPSFNIPAPLVKTIADGNAKSVSNFAQNIVPGPATATDEGFGGSAAFNLGETSNLIVPAFDPAPAINLATGELTFSAPPNGSGGLATYDVVLNDDEGTGNGGTEETSPAISITILIDDIISVTATDSDAREEGPNTGSFSVSRTATLDPRPVNVTRSGDAVLGNDFTVSATTGSVNTGADPNWVVTIPDGGTEAVLLVTPINDSTSEPADETVTLTVVAGPNYIVDSGNATDTVNIEDNEPLLVDEMVDESDGDFSVGDLSLREAVALANSRSQLTTLNFNLGGGAAPYTIAVNFAGNGSWPDITAPVDINGFSETGSSANTTATGVLDAAHMVALVGTNAEAGASGLTLQGHTGSTVRGLIIRNFTGPGIELNLGSGHSVQGNDIRNNGGAGALIDASDNNLIGGEQPANRNSLRSNAGDGVAIINNGRGNQIKGNNVSSNGGLGIDLNDDGVTLNDPGDGDASPNRFQNFPILESISSTTVSGTLNSTGSRNFRVEFFSNAAYDASGHGEGERFLGFQDVTTDGGGNAAVSFDFGTLDSRQNVITSTATDVTTGDTSEFSSRNVAPENTVPGAQNVNEDAVAGLVFGGSISIADSDNNGSDAVNVTLLVTNGTLTLNGTVGLSGTGNGMNSLDYSGTIGAINAALDGLRYDPDLNYYGGDTLTITVDDQAPSELGGNLTDLANVAITVNPIDDAPVFTIPTPAVVVPFNAGPQNVGSFATDISVGPATGLLDSGGQSLVGFTVTQVSAPPLLFTTPPALDLAGTLTFEVAPGETGMGTFDVILTDNGSNAPPNENTSPPEQITIRIDRPPNFTTAFSPISANLGDFIPAFFVGVADVDSSVGILVLSGSSDNQSVLPDGNIQVLGSGANRFLLLTPTGEGSATVTVSLTDGANTVTEQFTLTVSPMPDLVLTRDLPAFYLADFPLQVSIRAVTASGSVYEVEETTLPPGWTVSNISNGGSSNGSNVLFTGLIGDQTLSYVIRPPQSETGLRTFDGEGRQGGITPTIGGDTSISSPGTAAYHLWDEAFGPLGGPSYDHNLDGLNNLANYAFGYVPLANNSNRVTEVALINNDTELMLIFQRAKFAQDVLYFIQTRENMIDPWVDVPNPNQVIVSEDNASWFIKVTVPVPAEATSFFMRVLVEAVGPLLPILSEVFYDGAGSDDGLEWVEIYNPTSETINLSNFSLGNGGNDYSASTVQLSGTIAPGATFVVGGPSSNGSNGNPVFDQTVDFDNDFQNRGAEGDGVALFNTLAGNITPATVPIDAVVYGPNNNNGLIDETGSGNSPEVGDAPPGSSIERVTLNGDWQIRSAPDPNNVTF